MSLRTYFRLLVVGALEFGFLVMLLMKLCHLSPIASWSWWLIWAPIWLPLVYLVLFFFYVLVESAFVALFRVLKNRVKTY